MRLYETTFIVNPQTDDDSIDRRVADVSEVITNSGGKVLSENRMGTRRLAYQIQGLSQGYYTSVVFEGPMEVLPLLDRQFKLGEPYIRWITIQYEGPDPRDRVEPVEMPEPRPRRRHVRGSGRRADESAPAPPEPVRSAADDKPTEPKDTGHDMATEEPGKTEPTVETETGVTEIADAAEVENQEETKTPSHPEAASEGGDSDEDERTGDEEQIDEEEL